MKHSKFYKIFSIMLLGAASVTVPLTAQTGKVTLDSPQFDELPSPDVEGNTGLKNFKPKDWLEVEVKMNIEMPKSYTEQFINNVTVKWYVAIDEPGGKRSVYLEKEVTHINVPVGQDFFSSVYLSPAAVLRISGSDSAGKRVVTSVGGEVLVNGQPAHDKSGFFSSKGKPGWWTQLARCDKIQLRNKNETPFKFLWWDRYAEIEERR